MILLTILKASSPSTRHKKYGRISMHNFDPSKLTGSKRVLDRKNKTTNLFSNLEMVYINICMRNSNRQTIQQYLL
jgi:hypothetical protein